MKEKMKRFLRNNGFYLVLVGCVAVVFAAGIGILMHQDNTPDTPVISYATPVVNAPDATEPVNGDISGDSGEDAFHQVTASPEATATPTPQAPTSMVKPLEGAIQTEYSGKKLAYNKTTKEWRTHPGIDIEGSDGTGVKAACDGTVSAIKDDPRYGLTVILDHGGTVSTIYCGFSQVSVKEGASVKAGDTLGTLGGEIFCEREQGVHLHFEVLVGGSAVNPADYWK